MDPIELDWDKGLPTDVPALVAKAGGVKELKSMRGVCKAWQEGFELGVQGIKILGPDYPALPLGLEAARRFPGLTKLNLVYTSPESKSCLENLRSFPRLSNLILGNGVSTYPACLPMELDDADMAHLQVRKCQCTHPNQWTFTIWDFWNSSYLPCLFQRPTVFCFDNWACLTSRFNPMVAKSPNFTKASPMFPCASIQCARVTAVLCSLH